MPNYDYYEPYRPSLTDRDKKHLEAAAISNQDMFRQFQAEAPGWEPEQNRVPEGFRAPNGHIHYDQVAKVHIDIAMEHAKEQLRSQNMPMPEEEETTLRFPGISPKGKYSVIDMKLAQRWNDIEAGLPFASAQVAANINAWKMSTFYRETAEKVAKVSNQHRVLTRAEKLCRDENGQQLLHAQARALETDPAIIQMDQIMQGMEYLQGKRQTVPQDVLDLYQQHMEVDLVHTRETINTLNRTPERIDVKFENFDDIQQQRTISNPRNWNKTKQDLQFLAPTADEVDHSIRPYTIASVKQKLTPAFQRMEEAGFDPRDLVIVDGKSVQEHMNEKGAAVNSKEAAANYASMLVTSALMSGKQVETFIPSPDGKLPKEPAAVEASGYTPQQSGPTVLNTWERFFSRFGFYKEKAAQAEKHKQTMDARVRVLSNIENRALQKMERDPADLHKMFFGDQKIVPNTTAGPKEMPSRMPFPTAACICIMALDYPLEDILDPNKLQNEKQIAARDYRANYKNHGLLGQKLGAGIVELQNKLDKYAQSADMKDPIKRAQALPLLSAAAQAGHTVREYAQTHDSLLEPFSDEIFEADTEKLWKENKQVLRVESKTAYGISKTETFKQNMEACSTMANAIAGRNALNASTLSPAQAKEAVVNIIIGGLVAESVSKEDPMHFHVPDPNVQKAFKTKLMEHQGITDLANVISKDPNARTSLQEMLNTTPVSQAFNFGTFKYDDMQTNAAKLLCDVDNSADPAEAADAINRKFNMSLTEHLRPVLGKKLVLPNQMGK